MRSKNEMQTSPALPARGTYPARLRAEEVAEILGFNTHDIPVLVARNLIKPLARPVPNATKYFWACEVERLKFDFVWMNKSTQVLYDYWKGKNGRKEILGGTRFTENTAFAGMAS